MLAHCSRIGQSVIHNANEIEVFFLLYIIKPMRMKRKDRRVEGERPVGIKPDLANVEGKTAIRPSFHEGQGGRGGGYVIPAGE